MTDSPTSAPAEMAWATLMHRPVAYIDPARLAACFGGTVTTALCERLRATERLQDRLSAVIVAFYTLKAPLDPGKTAADDRRVALTPPERTADLVRRAGAIFYAGAIASAVRSDDVRRLRARLGEGLYAFALANRDLSGPSRVLAGDTDIIEEQGLRCLSAWCRSQPEAVGARVRLKSPPSAALDSLDTAVIDIGPAIVRRAAG